MADKKKDDLDEDLDGLQLAINEKSDETLECTRRMREMCAEAKDSGMKTLIALDDQEELIDKFEAAADGINADMALAEKALKVGCQSCIFNIASTAASLTIAAEFRFFLLHHLLQSLQGHYHPSNSHYPSFCTFVFIFDNLINLFSHLIFKTIKIVLRFTLPNFPFYLIRSILTEKIPPISLDH